MPRSIVAAPRSGRVCLMLVGALLSLSPAALAADHRDGPRITDLNNTVAGALDLNDLYIFVSPTNRENTVFIQTMSPGAGIVGPATFLPGALYELRISNDGNPLDDDEIVYQTVFSYPDRSGRQRFQIRRLDASGNGPIVSTGLTNSRPANISGGGIATAGLFDDPFFFDVANTARFNREATLKALGMPTGAPEGANPARYLLPPTFPNNFFGGANTLAIAFEIPRARIQSSRNNPNITAWIRSVANIRDGRGFAQFDRTALPSVNTVVVPLSRTINGEDLPNGMQVQFNHMAPEDDAELRPAVTNRLMTVFGLPQDQATNLANLFLPDVARFNTTSTAGFPNGRQLRDDVIDAELKLLTNNAVQGDRVVNDSYFRKTFPYIGTPNPVTRILANGFRPD